MSLAHVIAEVFPDTPLQGNQPAVFEDGPALSGEQMQRLPCALRVRDLFRLWSPSVATADRAWSHSSGSTPVGAQRGGSGRAS
jgi:hypothetical protein